MGYRILVPLDGSPGSESVLATVRELAQTLDTTVRLLHVSPGRRLLRADERTIAYADQETERVGAEALAYLKRVGEALPGISVERVARFGDPVTEIVGEAESGRIDLIAMATHHRTGLGRVIRGSVAERVEREALVPVILVRYGQRSAA